MFGVIGVPELLIVVVLVVLAVGAYRMVRR
jgi:Sec-independent protein translocase protein TatA